VAPVSPCLPVVSLHLSPCLGVSEADHPLGFSDEALSDHDVFDQQVTLLQQPFTPPELLRKIRSVLASPPPASA
jgi:hypothetical protein